MVERSINGSQETENIGRGHGHGGNKLGKCSRVFVCKTVICSFSRREDWVTRQFLEERVNTVAVRPCRMQDKRVKKWP